jgi:hypothetical protein
MNAMSWSGFHQANISAEMATEFWLQSCEEAARLPSSAIQGQARTKGNAFGAQIIYLTTSL